MTYSVKWITENLGITRKALRYYEDNGLIQSPRDTVNNLYRSYSKEDIDNIWTIKILIGMKFKAK